jgi:RHS repeat-associated protein
MSDLTVFATRRMMKPTVTRAKLLPVGHLPMSGMMPRVIRTLLILLTLGGIAAPTQAQTPPPTVEYYHLDAVGSVRVVTNQAGNVVRRHDYFPFGEGDGVAPGEDPLRFAGKERDAESGFDYFSARYYAQRTGRFTTVDPGHVGGNLFVPQAWNAYAYAGNNPLRFSDPTGTDYFVDIEGGSDFWFMGGPINEFGQFKAFAAGFTLEGGMWGGDIYNAAGTRVGSYTYVDRMTHLASNIAWGTRGVVETVGAVVAVAEFALAVTNPIASTAANCAMRGCSSAGAALAMVPHIRTTRMMLSTARVIARGDRIHKVDQLVAKFGGQAKNWVKMKAVDAAGREIHWYQHPGIGKVGIKLAGQPDPF